MRRGSRLSSEYRLAVKVAGSVCVDTSKPVLAVDFDNTIFDNHGLPWPEVGLPFPGAKEALGRLGEIFTIRVYSCRTNGLNAADWHKQSKIIQDSMTAHGIPFDDIVQWNEGKPFADYYIDDKGVRFVGDWAATAEMVARDWQKQLQLEAVSVNGIITGIPVKMKELGESLKVVAI